MALFVIFGLWSLLGSGLYQLGKYRSWRFWFLLAVDMVVTAWIITTRAAPNVPLEQLSLLPLASILGSFMGQRVVQSRYGPRGQTAPKAPEGRLQ